jgi:hypothetical protein
MWLSFERDINRFRVSVGLEPLRTGQGGWNMLNYHRVRSVCLDFWTYFIFRYFRSDNRYHLLKCGLHHLYLNQKTGMITSM